MFDSLIELNSFFILTYISYLIIDNFLRKRKVKKWVLKIALKYAIKLIEKWIKDNSAKKVNDSFRETVKIISDDDSNDFKFERNNGL